MAGKLHARIPWLTRFLGVPVSQQQLIWRSKVLDDDMSLEEYGFERVQRTLRLMLRHELMIVNRALV